MSPLLSVSYFIFSSSAAVNSLYRAEQGGICMWWIFFFFFFFFSSQLVLFRNQRALCLPALREAQYRWIFSVLCSVRRGLVCLLRDWPLLSGGVEQSPLRKPWTKGSPSSTNCKMRSRCVSQVHSADVKRSQVLFAGSVTNRWKTKGISINKEWPKWRHPSHADGLCREGQSHVVSFLRLCVCSRLCVCVMMVKTLLKWLMVVKILLKWSNHS